MSTNRTSPVSFLKLSADVASFYGFRPAREVERRAQLISNAGERPKSTGKNIHTFTTTAELCVRCSSHRPQDPVLAFYATPAPTHVPFGLIARETGEFGLQIVGTNESMGEVVLFKTIAAILNEWGTPAKRVRVNALGDRDSRERFMRELTAHVRKHAHRFHQEERERVSQNPTLLHSLQSEEGRGVASEAPRSITFLSERSRVHFRSILEHLEQLGFMYELDDSLVGDDRAHHIAFAMDLDGPDATVVTTMGGRYDEYLRSQGRRNANAGVGASIFFRKKGATQVNFACNTTRQKPKIYFAQLGLKAKLQGLTVIEMLRRAKVPVEQSFDPAHLSSQLAQAAAQGVSHLLIMGQREAIDGTIIVRSMQNSAQSTLQVSEIPRFLKTLRV